LIAIKRQRRKKTFRKIWKHQKNISIFAFANQQHASQTYKYND